MKDRRVLVVAGAVLFAVGSALAPDGGEVRVRYPFILAPEDREP